MSAPAFSSVLYRDAFGTAAMRAVFSDEAFIKAAARVEVGLARVQGRLGVIPAEAATAIVKAGAEVPIDWDKLKAETDNVGYPIIGEFRSYCGGHRMNVQILQALFADRANFAIVESQPVFAAPRAVQMAAAAPAAFAPDLH